MCKKLMLSMTLICMLLIPAYAQDDRHLEPEDSVFSDHQPRKTKQWYDDYEENVLQFFNEAYEKEIFARVIVFPSFSPEYVVAVSEDGGEYKLVTLEASVQLWPFEDLEEAQLKEAEAINEEERLKAQEEIQDLLSYVPESREKASVIRCEYPLPTKIGKNLYTLWGEMLFRTRYPDRRPITKAGAPLRSLHSDGVNYHFSFEYDYTRLTGKTWSPEEDSINGRFVALTDMLRNGCSESNSAFYKSLDYMVQELTSDLGKEVY